MSEGNEVSEGNELSEGNERRRSNGPIFRFTEIKASWNNISM